MDVELVPHDEIAEYCRRHGIVELALFGSAARGELRPDSDVDLLVTFAPDARLSLFDFAQIQAELSDLFGRTVDLVERGSIENPFMRRTIMRDATVLYAA
jgi:predicted nucleotidyltransferase